MSNSDAFRKGTPVVAAKKRSVWERCLVWGGILVLLILALMEWRSKQGHEETLSALETAFQTRNAEGVRQALTEDAVKSHVRGFAFRREEGKSPQRLVIYTWPSLFKDFKVVLTLNSRNEVLTVDTQLNSNRESQKRSQAGKAGNTVSTASATTMGEAFEAKGNLKNRKVKTGEHIVELPAQEEEIKSQYGLRCGSLVRELVRQAVLVTARNELGLSTRDQSFGEVILVDEADPRFPLQVSSSVKLQREAAMPVCTIELSRIQPDGRAVRWKKELTFEKSNLEDLVQKLEELSRGELVQVLQDAGFRKWDRPHNDSAPEMPKGPSPMEVVSQFAELKRIHAEVFAKGELDQLQEGLIRAYANLGDMTNFYWSVTSKAFKARALIYAQRYFSKRGATVSTLAHRAYARGLAGRHAAALDDIKAAAMLEGQPAPEWLKLIEAYCAYKPDVLAEAKGDDEELALYLLMRASRDFGSNNFTADAIRRFLQVDPASFRAYAALCEMHTVGTYRIATEGGFDRAWSQIYERFNAMKDLPAQSRQVVEDQAKQKQMNRDREHESRFKLIKSLRSSGADFKDESEPSWNMLADLLEEATFAQIGEVLYCEKVMLSVSSENSISQLRPLAAGHRLKNLLEAFTDDRQANAVTMSNLVKDFKMGDYEPQMPILAQFVYRIAGQDAYNHFQRNLSINDDLIYDDLWRAQSIDLPLREYLAPEFRKVSPHQPAAVTFSIQYEWNNVKQFAAEWEETYAKCPNVMIALGQRFRGLGQSDDAIRCLTKSIEVEPTYDAYETLADVYDNQGDWVAYEMILVESLKIPDFGLHAAAIEGKLANLMMRKGEWQRAQPFAMQAAQTYSYMGLIMGARCAEGLKDWKTSEALHRAISERYPGNETLWYFWCLRTERGNIKAARKLAESYWQKLKPPFAREQVESLFHRDLIDDKKQQALDLVRTLKLEPAGLLDTIDLGLDPRWITQAALVADELNDIEFRNKLFNILPQLAINHSPTELVNLANLFLGSLKDPDNVQWDEKTFDELITDARYDEVTFLYFAAGKFLTLHKLEELGYRYLQIAATSFNVDKRSCMSAVLMLRKQKIPIEETRLSELPDDLVKVSELVFDKAKRERGRAKFDAAEKHLNEALELRPGLGTALLELAELNIARGDYSAARKTYEDALQANPASAFNHCAFAWFLATCPDAAIRNGEAAIEHAEAASALRPIKDYLTLTVLAAAYAEANQFPKAAELENQAVQLIQDIPTRYNRLFLYREQKPYHEPGNHEAVGEKVEEK